MTNTQKEIALEEIRRYRRKANFLEEKYRRDSDFRTKIEWFQALSKLDGMMHMANIFEVTDEEIDKSVL